MNNNKRFSDWDDCQEVDCNHCDHYYTNACGGVPVAQKRSCTSFKASRGISLPIEIKRLWRGLKWLVGASVISIVFNIILLILYFMR